MLSRSAEGLYWMGRYLERTGFVCRLLQLQAEALMDRPPRDIHAGWRRLYDGVGREPPGGLGDVESDEFTLADSYTLAGDLTFERTNPDSVWNCFAQGRENARQVRHCVSAEMWQRINLAYLRIRDMDEPDIWAESPEKFYAGMTAEVAAIEGAASATMHRGEGWRFLVLGRALERAQASCALLLAQTTLDADEASAPDADADWGSLLKALHALEPYQLRYGVAVEPGAALDLIVTDPLLPGSLARLFDALAEETEALGGGPGADAGGAARRAAGRLSALVKHHWPDSGDRLALLRDAHEQSLGLHGLVASAYFAYDA